MVREDDEGRRRALRHLLYFHLLYGHLLVPFDLSSHLLYIQSALYLICSMTKHVNCSIILEQMTIEQMEIEQMS